jgi:integrase
VPRHFVLQVRKVSYCPTSPYLVHVPHSLQNVEGAKRRFFSKEAVAKTYVKRLSHLLGNYQLQALGLSDAQKWEASECFARLGRHNGSLRSAVDFYLQHLEEANRSLPVGALVDEFLVVKEQDEMSRKYLYDLRSKLRKFDGAFQGKLVCELTAGDLERWIRSMAIGLISMESYRRSISVALEFARRRGYAKINAAADVRIARKLRGEVTILTPDEVASLLHKCAPDLVPYIAICAFAGLRPSEACALDWSDVHLDMLQIEVRAKHSKTRRHRLVPIQPNLLRWLSPLRKQAGPIGYSRRYFRAAYAAVGIATWKNDVLRHSYGTYRLPILKSAEALALEMGNSPDVIFRHYRRPLGEQQGQEYFAIVPGTKLEYEGWLQVATRDNSDANA